MSDHLDRATTNPPDATPGREPYAAADRSGIPWERYVAALRRRRLLVGGIVLGALLLGALATRYFRPTYEVHSTIWLSSAGPAPRVGENAHPGGTLAATAWAELLRSYSVLDPVVDELSLFVMPAKAADSAAVAGFHAAPGIVPGKYALALSPDGRRYTLRDADGKPVEAGAVGDSIGRSVGFRWAPTAQTLGRDRTIKLAVLPPRQAALKLRNRIELGFPDTSFISLRLTGPQPARDARVINAIDRQFVATASSLVRGGQAQSAQQLGQQVSQAEAALRRSEDALRNYRAGTVGLPSQDDPSVAVRDPSFTALYDQRAELDSVRADRAALERALDGAKAGVDPAALLAIPSVRSAPELAPALDDLTKAQTRLETLRRTYTDEYKAVRDARADVDRIRQQTLPSLAAGVLARLRNRESELSREVARASGALRSVPARAIDQQRLQRDVQVNATLYNTLRSEYDAARLSGLGAAPGIAVLDSAVAPLEPSTNTVPGILLASLLGGVALAVAAALLLDASDPRIWHPDQVEEMGYAIVGAIPRAAAARPGEEPVAMAQVDEAMRVLRLALLSEMHGARPMALSVMSPEIGDGKSFVAVELARSFAKAGCRTILVDGDIRRGSLDRTFRVERAPGLTDHLAGRASLDEAIHASTQRDLDVMTSGTRIPDGPELLSSAALPALAGALGDRYDVVLFDTPPLGAGADAGCLAIATGRAVLVMRAGKTNRRTARNRLAQLRRLPIQFLGVVLNAIQPEGGFAPYAYLPQYALYAPRPYADASPADVERRMDVSRDGVDGATDSPKGARSSRPPRPENHW
ncbi:MAG: polysaccharide biosynthesis tyrosine autokinase [Gemmatimonadaceae bacterium]|nr:polysaccharide biosynthesis tyrosine autokinase [Gemmatimonadaceae bacterium]